MHPHYKILFHQLLLSPSSSLKLYSNYAVNYIAIQCVEELPLTCKVSRHVNFENVSYITISAFLQFYFQGSPGF